MKNTIVNKQPLVSIIVPIYNSEKYLPKCIESIRRQTYKNIEIILVNDGSTDNSSKIIHGFAKEDSRIKIIDQRNSGGIITRRNGIRKAKGDYVIIEDSDDWLNDNLVEKCVQFLNNNEELDIIRFGYICEPSKVTKNILNENRIDKTVLANKEVRQVIKLLLYSTSCNSIWNQMIRKSLFDFNDAIFKQIVRQGEDVQINLQIYQKARKVGFLKDNLYHYVNNPNGISNNIIVSKVIRNVKDNIYLNSIKRDLSVKYFGQANETFFINTTLSFLSGKIIRILANSEDPKKDIGQIEKCLGEDLSSYLSKFDKTKLNQNILKKRICSNIIDGNFSRTFKYRPICKILKALGLIK